MQAPAQNDFSVKPELKAVVFDMDGVIIESEYTHYQAICEAMGEKMTVDYPTFIEKCTGGDERFAMGRMAELSNINYDEELFQCWSGKKAIAYQRLIKKEAKAKADAENTNVDFATNMDDKIANDLYKKNFNAKISALEKAGQFPSHIEYPSEMKVLKRISAMRALKHW